MFLVKFASKEARNSGRDCCRNFAATLVSSRPRFHDVFPFKELCLWLSTNLLTSTLCYDGSWDTLFWAKRALKPENDSSEVVKSIISWLLTLWHISSWCHNKHGPAAKFDFKMAASKVEFRDEFLQDTRYFRAWNLVEWKNPTFICYKWRQLRCAVLEFP